MKTCRKCGSDKALGEFGKDASRPDGRHPYCRDCKNAARRAAWVWSERKVMTPEERIANKREVRRRYRARKGEELIRARDRAYVQANRDRHNERNRNYRARNPGYDTVQKRHYRQRNLERMRELGRKHIADRRARELEVATIPFTLDQLQARVAFFGRQCWMCGGAWTALDHVKPLSKGGPHMLANLRPACKPCNSRKWNRWPFETRFRL